MRYFTLLLTPSIKEDGTCKFGVTARVKTADGSDMQWTKHSFHTHGVIIKLTLG